MNDKICVGDVVLSLAGRDKGSYLLVVSVDDGRVSLSDGKLRKTIKPKQKNVKHVKKVSTVNKEFIEHIKSGKPTSNQRLKRVLKSETEKIGG